MYPSSVGGYNGTSSTPPSTSYTTPKYASHHLDQTFPLYGRRVSDPNNFRPPFPSSSSSASMSAVPHSPVVYPSLRNRRDTEADTFSEASHQSSNNSAATAPAALPSSNQSSSPPPPAFSEPRTPASAISMAPAGVLNANHFLDRELLLGVSIGFKPPPISLTLRTMEDPMPNIISLPYARCPPLHLQAPNWSHLLRLMARLSGTRIEPTVEAMAVNKGELKLRTVIQFIKVWSKLVNDWRTILWFTIDHLVPPSVPGASRYTSGNPNLLPWSYTLSPVPLLLRDATDTHISKTYTIPASDSVPLPTLPITFPNLALYLQAALDASRQHSGDSSSGLGKLGKTVQMCYPNVGQTGLSEFDIPERTSVSHLFKRVIGRSNKDKKKGKTSNNEETYQLVTPFVPDEWG
ncbi:hypothetical protein BDN70DRAFT_801413 [Pholiota conissans]|uniref:Uncharacterized protein n=1 Tax=Pholiota conissans TaxID=109636 RepID=A0A9P5Z6H0_9AGAR|nr:hypothetical protein BDN70DRAFT_801413 [Pholiota conissans]